MEMLDKFKELEYKIARKKYLAQVIQKIGIIEETNYSIICHVTQELLEKNGKRVFYELQCSGMNTVYENSRKLVDYFQLNKPVYYIFDGICFDSVVNISSLFSNIIFRNCTFNTGIRILFADNITFENNKYNCWTNFKDYGNSFFFFFVKKLTIKNDQFINSYDLEYLNNNFGFNIEVDTLDIDSSTICAESCGEINIKAKKTNIWNSNIKAPFIYFDSDSITLDRGLLETKEGEIIYGNSLLKAENGIIIENKDSNFCININSNRLVSPCTIYNGVELITNQEGFKDEELKKKRLALVNTLTNVINKCNQNTLIKSASINE